MPQSIPANAVVEITMLCNYQSSRVMNVFHYYNSMATIPEADGVSELTSLGGKFTEAVLVAATGGLLARLVESFEIPSLRLQVVAPTRQYYMTHVIGVAGSQVDDGIPSDTNMTITLRPMAVGKGLSGNKKITGLPISTLEGPFFTTDAVTGMNTSGDKMRLKIEDSVGAERWVPIIWSPTKPADRRGITITEANNEVRVLRRRQVRLGI